MKTGKGAYLMEKRKKLPIGVENFSEFHTDDFYYVDKTQLIKTLLDNGGKVSLFTRPRRFGKSLNMSMLRSFFEIGTDPALSLLDYIFHKKQNFVKNIWENIL